MSPEELEQWRREGERLAARREQADAEDAPLIAEVQAMCDAYRQRQAFSRLPFWARWLVSLGILSLE